MSESHAGSTGTIKHVVPEIPIEIVSEEHIAQIDAALAATSCLHSSSTISGSCSPSRFQRNARSISSITAHSKRSLFGPDIEDSGDLGMTHKRNKATKSLLEQFMKNRCLPVTDLVGSEWCEKKMEFILRFCRKRVNEAMRAGQARHEKLEEEGVWMAGKIDEIRMPKKETDRDPILVETKTRTRDTLPTEPQRRNGRLQLMCYQYMWDDLAGGNFPSRQFFHFFSLNPDYVLSEEIRESTANEGFPAKTLDDMVRFYQNTWSMLPPAYTKLLLRYEFQNDQSLVVEENFSYDHDWLKGQIQARLEFWKGVREAGYVPGEECWKCNFCQFATTCPAKLKPESTPHSSQTDSNSTPS